MSKNAVKQIACGILYNHSFKLLDNWGTIADSILYGNKYFPEKYFPNISAQYTTARSLTNEKIGHSLQLTASNLIYTHSVQDGFEKEYERVQERIVKYLVPEIIEKNNLITRRIGIVFVCDINETGIQTFAKKYFKPEFHSITDFRFSKKEPTGAGRLNASKGDFINKIYTVGSIGDELTGIVLDYQMHFIPPREDIKKQIISVLEQGKSALNEEILSIEG